MSSPGISEDVKAEQTCANNTVRASGRPTGSKAALEAFQMRIAGASELSRQGRDSLISEAFHACCPDLKDYTYTVMVIRELLQLQCDPKAVLAQLNTPSFVVPNIYSHEALDLLVSLEKIMSQHPHCLPEVYQIYISMAESASVNDSVNPYQDTRLLALVRQLWHAAHLHDVGLDRSILILLRFLARRCRNKLYRRTLSTIFAVASRLEDTAILPHLIARTAEDPGLVSAVAQILLCVPKDYLSASISMITLTHARNAYAPYRAEDRSAKHRAQMHVWLLILHRLDAEAALPDRSLVEKANVSLAEYVLTHPENVQERLPILLFALVVKASQTAAFRDVPFSKISDILTNFSAKVEQSGDPSIDATLGILMTQVLAKNLPYQALAEMIINYFNRYLGVEATSKFLQVLQRRRMFLANSEPLPEMVLGTLAHVKSKGSRLHDGARLRACAKVLDILNLTGSITEPLKAKVDILEARRQFQHIRSRARINRTLPVAYRKVNASSPVEQRVGLIHQLAHQYTTDTTLSRFQAWRATLYLYRYLQQHSLPIGPLFTKAVVRICIIRPLAENRFVSAKRLIWVCKLVASIEGEEVGKQIESLFWLWRGELIQHAKSVHVDAGGDRQDKAQVGTMKKLGLI